MHVPLQQAQVLSSNHMSGMLFDDGKPDFVSRAVVDNRAGRGGGRGGGTAGVASSPVWVDPRPQQAI